MATDITVLPRRYRDPELVARGGMGEVYCATDTSLGRPVAIKVLDSRLSSDVTIRRRFEREARTAAQLSGEAGIITIFDVGEFDGRPFIVMEYIPGGRSLQDVVREEGAQAPAAVVRWLEQAARALDYAHRRGVVHRDVKPSNLLLDEHGRVRVADFGVASAAGLDSLTQTGTVIGTAGYLSPEQAQGRPASAASDRYALGVVAFELLTGSRPFENANATAEAAAHVHAQVPSLAARSPGVPFEVDVVVARALAKDPERRFRTCAELVGALRSAFEHGSDTTRILVPYDTSVRRPRRRVWPFVLLLLGLAGVAASIVVAADRGAGSTVTSQATTVVQTVTTRTPPSTAPAETTPAGGGSGPSLASQGYDKVRAGDYAAAVPLLQEAARQLAGSGTLSEAYNDYNLAYALAKTQGCSADVLHLLDASEAIQGHRDEIDQLRKACRRG